jgi:hypothetical protein
MTDKIFFFHNPRAGGTSLTRVLESRFPPEKRCPIVENTKVEHDDLCGRYERFRGYDLYAGHYGHDIFAAVQDGHVCITNFRHPATRLISLYNYFNCVVNLPDEELQKDRFYAVRFAKSASFGRFVSSADSRVEVYVRNWHFRQLANSCWSLETNKPFDRVCRFIDSMPCYYVCEYPEASILWMRRALNWNLNRLPQENATGEKAAISFCVLDEQTHRAICQKNELDFAIHRYAVDRLLKQGYLPERTSTRLAIFGSSVRNLGQFFGRK